MKNSALLIFFLCSLFSIPAMAQQLEVGPMVNYDRTSFNIPDSSFIVIGGPGGGSEGSRTTGFETNYSVGAYGTYYFHEHFGIAGELYYTETSATEFDDNVFKSLNFIPYITAELWNTNIYLNLGGGFAYMLDTSMFDGDYNVNEEDIQSFDIPIKMAVNYRITDIITIDLGIHTSATRVVKDDITRVHHYLGIKVPLNRILSKG
ncbi:outer membrane beta-barrel protein [Altibacter lentus]|uniref:outer membrane beta-barrel protein n=1 Tax=Altibacter lentus TaxID=1223410 RepID=UPI0005570D93|nr:outer membrane beta-barrel protein [Altibacter lentus]